jgi:hypothetical protein
MQALWAVPQAARQVWLRGPAVQAWCEAQVLDRHGPGADLTSERVEIHAKASGANEDVFMRKVAVGESRLQRQWARRPGRPSGRNEAAEAHAMSDLVPSGG